MSAVRATVYGVSAALIVSLGAGASEVALASTPGIPASVRSVLLASAVRIATEESDRHPYDLNAVRTTIAGADRATHCHCRTFTPPPTTEIYLVAMKGHFSCNTCPGPPGALGGKRSVITLEFMIDEPASAYGFGWTNRYPNLKLAGEPIRLSVR